LTLPAGSKLSVALFSLFVFGAVMGAGTLQVQAQFGNSPEAKAAREKQLALEKTIPQLNITEEHLTLTAPGHTLGETEGVSKNSKGHLFVYSRTGTGGSARGGTAAELFEFDQNLKFVKLWGPDNYAASFAHSVRVDKYDNVWMVDEGSGMIVKFIHLSKGLSDFNVTRNIVINGLWTVPTPASFSGPLSFVAKGWELGAVFEASDGTPLWTLGGIEGDPMGQLNGEPMSIPDYVSGCNLTNPSSGRSGTLQYINPNCFINAVAPNAAFANAAPPFGCDQTFITNYAANNPNLPPLNPLTCINLMGNLGRNTVIGPGLLNLDFSVVKDNYIKKITESFNVQFRAEFFNVLNRTNFAPPSAGNLEARSATGTVPAGFGILTSTQVPNREIQFALKLIW
jgi:hypothetical protein